MTTILNRFLQVFSYRYSSILCIIFALINRIYFSIFASNIGRDERLQLTITENLLAGNCFCQVKYFTADLYNPVYYNVLRFPPGFSLFMVPFLKLFNNNVSIAYTAFNISCGILFVFLIRLLCKKIDFPVPVTNIVTVIAGCFQFIFFMDSSTADLLALDFLIAGMIISISIINSNKIYRFYEIAAYGFIFFLPAFFRYMYIPFVCLFPLLLLFDGLIRKNKRLKVTGIWLTVSTIVFLSLLMIFLFTVSSTFVRHTERGFFPEQLLYWHPFFVSSFINVVFTSIKLTQLSGILYSTAFRLLMFCNLFILPLFFLNWKLIWQRGKFIFFPAAGWALSILILLQLGFLTSTYSPQLFFKIGSWNYTTEGRYYAFVNVFIILIVFYHAAFGNVKKNYFIKGFLSVIFILVAMETMRGLYYNVKLLFNYKEMRNEVLNHEIPNKYFHVFLDSIRKNSPAENIFVSSPDSYYVNFAAANGAKSIYDPLKLNTDTLSPPPNSILIFIIEHRMQDKYKSYLKNKNLKLIKTVISTDFYIEQLSPAR